MTGYLCYHLKLAPFSGSRRTVAVGIRGISRRCCSISMPFNFSDSEKRLTFRLQLKEFSHWEGSVLFFFLANELIDVLWINRDQYGSIGLGCLNAIQTTSNKNIIRYCRALINDGMYVYILKMFAEWRIKLGINAWLRIRFLMLTFTMDRESPQ